MRLQAQLRNSGSYIALRVSLLALLKVRADKAVLRKDEILKVRTPQAEAGLLPEGVIPVRPERKEPCKLCAVSLSSLYPVP